MNTEPQPSLATLLYPPVGDGRAPEDADGHELMEYFQHEYQQGQAATSQDARSDAAVVVPLPGKIAGIHSRSPPARQTRRAQEQQQQQPSHSADGERLVRSPSPLNPAIHIPSALSQLASRVIPGIDLPDLSTSELAVAQEQALLYVDYGERGEMGGKRRKAPHERAGWKEMDQQPPGKKRKSRKADQSTSDGAAAANVANIAPELAYASGASPNNVSGEPASSQGGADMGSLTELSRMALQGPSDASQPPGGSHIDPTLAAVQASKDNEEDTSKLSRAEQNKRAQQAFRRRREEHMKKLELDSAQLESTKRLLAERDATLRDLLLTIEASKVESAALQTVIKHLVPHSRASPLSRDGQLVVDEAAQVRAETRPSSEELNEAFAILGKQARELAKQSRLKGE